MEDEDVRVKGQIISISENQLPIIIQEYTGSLHEEWFAYVVDLILYPPTVLFHADFFGITSGNPGWPVSLSHSDPQSTF